MKILDFKNIKWLLLITFILHLITSINSVGFHHLDEHYQILEFANYKLGNNQPSDLPWEFEAKLRPAVQPAIAFLIIKFSQSIGITDPFTQSIFLRILSFLLSLLSVCLLLYAFKEEIKSKTLLKWFLYLSFFLWFAVYSHVRFSSEGWSGSLFFIGFALFYYFKHKGLSNFNLISIGIIFGFAFIFRYQVGLLVFGLILWLLFIDRMKFKNLIILTTGIIAAILIGVFIDKWFYGSWTFSAWNYFQFNILQGRVSNFGVHTWHFYITEIFIKGVPPFSLFLIFLPIFWFVYKPKSSLTWMFIPFLLIHFLIGHKELRFLFPLINIIPLFIVLAVQELEKKKFKKIGLYLQGKKFRWFIYLFLIVNSIYLINICFRPADYYVSLYQFIYKNYKDVKTELIFSNEDPYLRAPEPANFYKSKNLLTKIILNTDSLQYVVTENKFDKILFMTDTFLLDNKYKTGSVEFKKVYSNLPKWVENFNYNHWLERTRIFTLYEISKIQK